MTEQETFIRLDSYSEQYDGISHGDPYATVGYSIVTPHGLISGMSSIPLATLRSVSGTDDAWTTHDIARALQQTLNNGLAVRVRVKTPPPPLPVPLPMVVPQPPMETLVPAVSLPLNAEGA